MAKHVYCVPNDYVIYSTKWGSHRTGPYVFDDQWQRMRAASKELKLSRQARNRLEWFIWYQTTAKGNGRATCRHFGIAPKVFYYWLKRLKDTGLPGLADRSRKPEHLRSSAISPVVEERLASLRRRHLHYSKIKIAVIYEREFGVKVSSWQVQRVIERYDLYPNPKKALRNRKKRRKGVVKKRITELMKQPQSGFLFSIDTIVLWMYGEKRYVLTAMDQHSRFAFARMYTTHSSKSAADFLRRLYVLMNGKLSNIQTDNGSEFHKYFEKAIVEMGLEHWWSRTRHPKDNAGLERFNRTLQEEFIREGNAVANPIEFNRRMTQWLIEYDFCRPHKALGYKTPIQVLCPEQEALPMYPSPTFP